MHISSLPTETLQDILGYAEFSVLGFSQLRDVDFQPLKALSLVCYQWRELVKKILFRDLRLGIRFGDDGFNSPTLKGSNAIRTRRSTTLDELLVFLRNSPSIARCVRRLNLENMSDSTNNLGFRSSGDPYSLYAVLRCLTNLGHLTLRGFSYPTRPEGIPSTEMISLQTLSIHLTPGTKGYGPGCLTHTLSMFDKVGTVELHSGALLNIDAPLTCANVAPLPHFKPRKLVYCDYNGISVLPILYVLLPTLYYNGNSQALKILETVISGHEVESLAALLRAFTPSLECLDCAIVAEDDGDVLLENRISHHWPGLGALPSLPTAPLAQLHSITLEFDQDEYLWTESQPPTYEFLTGARLIGLLTSKQSTDPSAVPLETVKLRLPELCLNDEPVPTHPILPLESELLQNQSLKRVVLVPNISGCRLMGKTLDLLSSALKRLADRKLLKNGYNTYYF